MVVAMWCFVGAVLVASGVVTVCRRVRDRREARLEFLRMLVDYPISHVGLTHPHKVPYNWENDDKFTT
jgi:uncharacterized membrane protein HdeD (DUF308 family)